MALENQILTTGVLANIIEESDEIAWILRILKLKDQTKIYWVNEMLVHTEIVRRLNLEVPTLGFLGILNGWFDNEVLIQPTGEMVSGFRHTEHEQDHTLYLIREILTPINWTANWKPKDL